jgi:hypothetical protein
MPRRVRVFLCSSAGDLIGSLPPFDVGSPWWPDVEPIVEGARHRFGADVIVLRLLDTDADPATMGGSVRYLAELIGEPPSAVNGSGVDADAIRSDDPNRAPWARPGWVIAAVGWADTRLDAVGRSRTGRAVQVKTWNLSSVVRLPTERGDAWLKSTPTFMVHEGAILSRVAADSPSLVPRVLADDPANRTVLLDDVVGEDQWDAPPALLTRMVRTWVALQSRWADRAEQLVTAGLPDMRSDSLPPRIAVLVRRPDVRDGLSSSELTELDAIVHDLPERLAALRRCGLPETLVHGDFHPGNWRSAGGDLVLMDWGDCCVGHALLDMAAFLQRVPPEARENVRAAWTDAWLDRCPEADPERAARLVAPLAALREALVYRTFLDGIERSERRYHEADVPAALRRALAVAD